MLFKLSAIISAISLASAATISVPDYTVVSTTATYKPTGTATSVADCDAITISYSQLEGLEGKSIYGSVANSRWFVLNDNSTITDVYLLEGSVLSNKRFFDTVVGEYAEIGYGYLSSGVETSGSTVADYFTVDSSSGALSFNGSTTFHVVPNSYTYFAVGSDLADEAEFFGSPYFVVHLTCEQA